VAVFLLPVRYRSHAPTAINEAIFDVIQVPQHCSCLLNVYGFDLRGHSAAVDFELGLESW
jgi:hypothetical protein